ncbi:MAG TPA: Gfo/Idh/MocA family oxidoreductase [Candidatus Handelsmanbacteria bacterium]|nr:Gfo/Idh/MocA family oxidoreductase [Candidatus Handelsmanbacteria bacterium]
MVGIGVVGAGYWGPNLIRNFAAISAAQMVAVADRDRGRLEHLALQFPGVGLVETLDELLADKRIQGIALATPADSHFPLAKRVLEAGKGVFVEKPLARSVAECEELIDLAEAKGQVLMVGHTFEYNAAVKYVEECIDRRELGEVYYIYAQRLNLGVVRRDVNALWNLAPHDISIALRWLKQMPVKVDARGYTYLQEGVEDVVYLNMQFADGVAVHIHVSWLDPGKVRRTTIVGSEKMIVYDDASTEAKIQLFDKGIDHQGKEGSLGDFDSFGKFQLIQRAGDVLIPRIDFAEPLRVECEHFAECVGEGRRPITDGANGLRVVKILEAATRSLAEDGLSVRIP